MSSAENTTPIHDLHESDLIDPRETGGRLRAYCPIHGGDHKRSLSIALEGDVSGYGYCHACGAKVRVSELLHTKPKPSVIGYPALEGDGTLKGVHMRKPIHNAKGEPDKKMWWERHEGRKVNSMPLYPLMDLLDAKEEAAAAGVRLIVILCEGEHKVDIANAAIRRAGKQHIIAIGTMTGAGGTPCDESLRPLLDCEVWRWPDADLPEKGYPRGKGMAHMQRIGKRLVALGAPTAHWVNWQEAPPKGDAADFFTGGGTVEQIEAMVVTDANGQVSEDHTEDEDGDEKMPPSPASALAMTVAPFPTQVLPKAFRALVTVGAQAIHCPPDFLGVPLLALAGVAIGNGHCIQIKRGWQERARIWTAIVALPGDKKSPALDLVSYPFREHQLEAAYRAAYRAWQAAKEDDPDDREPEPTMEQVFTTDATLEALADLLAENPRGILFSRDELTGWVLSMNQYKGGKGVDRQNWLSLWNGAPVVINRRGRRHPVYLHAPFVGVVGAMPPDVLGDLSDERGREDGFIHRILFSFPTRMVRKWTDAEVSDEILAAYNTAFSRLWDLREATDTEGHPQTRVLPFTYEAKRRWVQWMNTHDQEQDDPAFPDGLRGPWSKMDGYAARLALILHLCRQVCKEADSQEVDEKSMNGAVQLIAYFKSHVKAVYARLHATPEDLRIVALVAWIRRQPGEQTTARELVRSGIANIQRTEDAKALLEMLAERGYGKTETAKANPSKPGKAGLRFTLHAQHLTLDKSPEVRQEEARRSSDEPDNSPDISPTDAPHLRIVKSIVRQTKTHSHQATPDAGANCQVSDECNEVDESANRYHASWEPRYHEFMHGGLSEREALALALNEANRAANKGATFP